MLLGRKERCLLKDWTEEQLHLLGEVLPYVAQQFRMPLNNLALSVQQLAVSRPDGTERDKCAQEVLHKSYLRLLRLVGNLDLAPLLLSDEPFPRQNTDVVAWLDALCLQAEGLFAEKGVTLRWEVAMPYHITALHKEYMDRLLWNLLNNALKFTPNGGRVTVTLKAVNGQLLLTVNDTGCGIPTEQMETVFDRWLAHERQDPAPHGLGLGLPICRRIAEGHGGLLLLSSREGEGTTATVSLADITLKDDTVRDTSVDYAGGFSRALLELSDALPYTAFTPENVDLEAVEKTVFTRIVCRVRSFYTV